MTNDVTTIAEKFSAPVPVLGTWEAARSWLGYAKQFEQCKLFAQTMLGFELLEQQRKNGVKHGNNQKASTSQLGKPWEELLEEELKIPKSSAYRFMEMAKKAAPKLRRMIGIKGLDLLNTPISKLPMVQQHMLTDAVKKLTDGKTQLELGIELGMYRAAKAGANPGDKRGGNKTAPTIKPGDDKTGEDDPDDIEALQPDINLLNDAQNPAVEDATLRRLVKFEASLSTLLTRVRAAIKNKQKS